MLGLTLACIAVGGGLWLSGFRTTAGLAWAAATFVALVPLTVGMAHDLRAGRVGVDVIALLAMAGSLVLGQYLAGAVIAVMLSGGQVLERYATERAKRELSALVERAPRSAHRLEAEGPVTIPADQVRVGDHLLVKAGEVIPVDGLVESQTAVIDESALTGEARPVERERGGSLRSGAVDLGAALEMIAGTTAAESTYSAIVRLTKEAAASKAPMVRLADRFAIVFLPLTLAVAVAAWLVSGDPVRALAVLVVATPCPLILAAPVAIVAGMSRAASRGIVVKGGGALEALGRARVVLFDKTGTLTEGRPALARIACFGAQEASEMLRLAASLDQVSAHVLAGAVVAAAEERDLHLSGPSDVEEVPGAGIRGTVEGRNVALGKAAWVSGDGASPGNLPAPAQRLRTRSALDGTMTVFVAVDGQLSGALVFEDRIREETPLAVRRLREAGVTRVLVVTGDRLAVGEAIGRAIGADGVLADQEPAAKVAAVRSETKGGATVMVGDGVNDAPALAAADVGIAMGARGASASSQAADAVITVDRLDRVAEAVRIARRARTIAMQSILAGMGLSLIAMGAAAAGLLLPVQGALLQEAIDVLVILNALRALSGRTPSGLAGDLPVRMAAEHRRLRTGLDELLDVADSLGNVPPVEARRRLATVQRFLESVLLPHEAADQATLYPLVARAIGGRRPTEVMAREHAEIQGLVHNLGELVSGLPPGGPGPEDLPDLRRMLYGLHAVLGLHFAQEDQSYLPLLQGSS